MEKELSVKEKAVISCHQLMLDLNEACYNENGDMNAEAIKLATAHTKNYAEVLKTENELEAEKVKAKSQSAGNVIAAVCELAGIGLSRAMRSVDLFHLLKSEEQGIVVAPKYVNFLDKKD